MSGAMPDAQTDRLLAFVTQTFAGRIRQRGLALEPSTPLFSNGLIDSMGLIELLAFAEREFRVSLDATVTELTALDTADALIRHIRTLPRT